VSYSSKGQQQVKLNLAEVEKFAQGQAKNINYYKIKAQSHEFKSMEATSQYSEDAQKRMLEAACVKFLKRKKSIEKAKLYEIIQNDLYRFFNPEQKQYHQVIELLIQKEYCKALPADVLEYLP